MDEEVRLSRLRISRRRALSVGGGIGLAGLLATYRAGAAQAAPPPPDELVTLLDQARTCRLTRSATAGPYWFDVENIRTDIRESRPGAQLDLAFRVQDITGCAPGAGTAVPNAVVEIWHCDAGGLYSGYEAASRGANGGGGGPTRPPGGGQVGMGDGVSDGPYSSGERESRTTDDGTYLRGAQVADGNGIVAFTTIYPGWYTGRTPHIHARIHIDRRSVLTTQVYFDDALSDQVYAAAPYSAHRGTRTRNNRDSYYNAAAQLTTQNRDGVHFGLLNLGIDT